MHVVPCYISSRALVAVEVRVDGDAVAVAHSGGCGIAMYKAKGVSSSSLITSEIFREVGTGISRLESISVGSVEGVS